MSLGMYGYCIIFNTFLLCKKVHILTISIILWELTWVRCGGSSGSANHGKFIVWGES